MPASGRGHYVPYMIAAAFVVMTALLTLLLTLAFDNKAELDRVMASRQETSGSILADARRVFGLETATITSGQPASTGQALLDEDLALSPSSAELSITENELAQPVPPSSTPATGSSQPMTAGEPSNALTTLATAKIIQKADASETLPASLETLSQSTDPTTDRGKLPYNIVQTDDTERSLPTAPDKMLDKLATSSQNLDQIIEAHDYSISHLKTVILTSQRDNRWQIQQSIHAQLQLLDNEFREVEEQIQPTYIESHAAQERMANRRRASFQRMMQRRGHVLEKTYENHDRLRDRYTSLLELLSNLTPVT